VFQVVALAVYMNFFFDVIGSQFLGDLNEQPARMVPFGLIADFIIYFGMMKASMRYDTVASL
jgi:hypothetical protein